MEGNSIPFGVPAEATINDFEPLSLQAKYDIISQRNCTWKEVAAVHYVESEIMSSVFNAIPKAELASQKSSGKMFVGVTLHSYTFTIDKVDAESFVENFRVTHHDKYPYFVGRVVSLLSPEEPAHECEMWGSGQDPTSNFLGSVIDSFPLQKKYDAMSQKLCSWKEVPAIHYVESEVTSSILNAIPQIDIAAQNLSGKKFVGVTLTSYRFAVNKVDAESFVNNFRVTHRLKYPYFVGRVLSLFAEGVTGERGCIEDVRWG
jgi:hypothetical protein